MAIAGLARDVSGYAMAIVFVALDSKHPVDGIWSSEAAHGT